MSVKARKMKPPEMALRDFNKFVKLALEEAGRFWVENYLPKHFEPSAVQRYGYEGRRAKYLQIKQRMRFVRRSTFARGVGGTKIPAPKPPAPLVWSGDLRREVLGRSPDDYNYRTTSTSKKTRLQVPVKTPHPLNPKNAGELVRMNNAEFKLLNVVFVNSLARMLREEVKGEETKTIAA